MNAFLRTDFSSPVATAEFSKFASILSAALSQHHLLGFEIAQLELQGSIQITYPDLSHYIHPFFI